MSNKLQPVELTLAITLAVDFPTNPPIYGRLATGRIRSCRGHPTLPMANSKPRVDAKPLLGANQEENILYWAICVAMSPRARITLPPIIKLNERTVVAAATNIDPSV